MIYVVWKRRGSDPWSYDRKYATAARAEARAALLREEGWTAAVQTVQAP